MQTTERATGAGRPGARADEESAISHRYHQLVELSPDGILIHDDGVVVMANAALMTLVGASARSDLIGKSITDFLSGPFLRAVENRLLRPTLAGDGPPIARDSLRRLDGSRVEVEVTAIPFLDNGHPSAHLIIRDISERLASQVQVRLAEERMREAQKMESIGALAGGVAHEVNNMMVVVLGATDFLLRESGASEERLRDLGDIHKAAERAATLTRQLLSFSQQAIHAPHVLDLDAMMRELEPALRRLLGQGPVLTTEYGGPLRIRVDSGQIEQVIVNLVLNARYATPVQGTITIATRSAVVGPDTISVGATLMRPGQYAQLEVRDNGSGIDPAVLCRLFEPFFTTKPVGEGTGLGLSAAFGIMEQHRGYITVDSRIGAGSTFGLYFPLVADDLEATAPILAPPVTTANRWYGATILVVDDEPSVRRITRRVLEGVGYRVRSAPDGAVALDVVAREGTPDLVVTDLMMPGIGGAELSRRLRLEYPALPVLFMSGFSAEHVQQQWGLDCDGSMLQKPFTPAELIARIAGVLSRVAKPRGSGR